MKILAYRNKKDESNKILRVDLFHLGTNIRINWNFVCLCSYWWGKLANQRERILTVIVNRSFYLASGAYPTVSFCPSKVVNLSWIVQPIIRIKLCLATTPSDKYRLARFGQGQDRKFDLLFPGIKYLFSKRATSVTNGIRTIHLYLGFASYAGELSLILFWRQHVRQGLFTTGRVCCTSM